MKVYLLREERNILSICGEHGELYSVEILVFDSFEKAYNKMLELAEKIKKEYNEDKYNIYIGKKYEIKMSKNSCEIYNDYFGNDYHELIIEEKEIL